MTSKEVYNKTPDVLSYKDILSVGDSSGKESSGKKSSPQCPNPTQKKESPIVKTDPPDEDGSMSPGTMVDHFRIKRLIGRGGMGEVYLARDTRLGRRVALKIIHRENLGLERSVTRFLLEARNTARFSHPHIVTIFAVGEHEGSPYLALEYLEGASLRDRIDGERLSLRETTRLALAIAQALQEAHKHRILHRDLKPDNVILPKDGRLRVVDFGLAKSLRAQTTKKSEDIQGLEDEEILGTEVTAEVFSETGTKKRDLGSDAIEEAEEAGLYLKLRETVGQGFYGTPAYMSPEQWRQKPCTEASDMWSFGIMAYELLAGERPFGDESHPLALAVKICESTAIPAVDTYRDIPETLGALVDRCLSKNPEQRPSAEEAVIILERFLSQKQRLPDETTAPFRGLMPFDERHANLFFGREADIDSLTELLRTQPVLPLVGPSGSGKSSLVQAGLIPRLREQGRWLIISLRPGNDPINTLAERITGGLCMSNAPATSFPGPRTSYSSLEAVESPSHPLEKSNTLDYPGLDKKGNGEETNAKGRIEEENVSVTNGITAGNTGSFNNAAANFAGRVLENPEILNLELQKLSEKRRMRVLLFVDQMEEVFALVDDEKTRQSFLEAVCLAADDPADPVRVVFTLRDDFLGKLASGRVVPKILSRVSVVRSPDRNELRRIITNPLKAFGYQYEDSKMVDEILDEVMEESINLPILQFTCRSLWNRRDQTKKVLTRSAFKNIGGVGGALVSHADGVLKGMSQPGLKAARHIFMRLVTTEGTRRIMERKELLETTGEEGESVLERLVAARLITVRSAQNEDSEETEYELIHESLIHRWRTLNRWLEESREDLHFLEQVSQAAKLWEIRGCLKEEVWEGPALEEALRTAHRCESPIPERVARFLSASEDRHRKKRFRRSIILAVSMALLVTIAIISTIASFALLEKEREVRLQRDKSQKAKALAEKRNAQSQISSAKAAFSRGDVLEARALLRSALPMRDSPMGRALWWKLDRLPLLWKRNINAPIYDVKWSPDGTKIAAASRAGSLLFFDVDTAETNRLRGIRGSVLSMDFSPAGGSLVAGTSSGEVWFWNLKTGESRTTKPHSAPVWGVTWDPTGQKVASGGTDGDIAIWSPTNPQTPPWKYKLGKRISRIKFSPNGEFLSVACMNGNIDILKTVPGKNVELKRHFIIQGFKSSISDLTFSPEGRLLAAAAKDGTIPVWDISTNQMVHRLKGHKSRVNAVDFSSDGSRLASGSVDTTIAIWNTRTWKKTSSLKGHRAPIWTVSFSPQDDRLVSGGGDHELRVWLVKKQMHAQPITPHNAEVITVACHPQQDLIASGGYDNRILLWNKTTGEPEDQLEGHEGNILSISFSENGKTLISGSQDATIRIWDMGKKKLAHTIKAHSQGVHAIAAGPDNKTIASAGTDRTIRLFNIENGEETASFKGHTNSIWSLAFSPNGKTLASGSWDKTIRIWNIATLSKRPISVLKGHTGNIWALKFAPDGRTLYSGSWDGTLRTWDTESGRCSDIKDLESPINGLDISRDGKQMVVAFQGGELLFRDLVAKKDIRVRAHKGDVNAVAFCGDDSSVFSSSDDTTVRLWSLEGLPKWNMKSLLRRAEFTFVNHRGWFNNPEAGGVAAWRKPINSPERHLEKVSVWAEGAVYNSSGDPIHSTPNGSKESGTKNSEHQGSADDHSRYEKICALRHDDMIEAFISKPFKRLFIKPLCHNPKETNPPGGRHISEGTEKLNRSVNRCSSYARELFTTPLGCTLQIKDALVLYKWDGTKVSLRDKVECATFTKGLFVTASNGMISFINDQGQTLKTHSAPKDIVALSPAKSGFFAGYRDGTIEHLKIKEPNNAGPPHQHKSRDHPIKTRFEGPPASPVTVFNTDMKDLLFAGFEDGSVVVWSLLEGRKLLQSKLHGSIRHLVVQDHILYALSDLGKHERFDLSVFHLPYKTLVEEISRKVTVIWSNGRPVRANP